MFITGNMHDQVCCYAYSYLDLNAKLMNFFEMAFRNIYETLRIAWDDNEDRHFFKK